MANDTSWIRQISPNDLLKEHDAMKSLEATPEDEDEPCALHCGVKAIQKDPEGGWRVVSEVSNVADFMLALAEGLSELEKSDEDATMEKAIGEFLESVTSCENGWCVTSHVEEPEQLALFLCPSELMGLETEDNEWDDHKGADSDALPVDKTKNERSDDYRPGALNQTKRVIGL